MNPVLDLTLAEIVTRRVRAVQPGCTLEEAAQLMGEAHISCLVVTDAASHPVGILTERDLVRLLHQRQPPSTEISALMTTPVVTASAQADFATAYALMQSHQVRHLVAISDNGELFGVASETDVRTHLSLDFLRRCETLATIMDEAFPALPPDATLDDALRLMLAKQFDYVIVVDHAQPIGIVTERDLPGLLSRHQDPTVLTLFAVASSPVMTVRLDQTVFEVIAHMASTRRRHFAVVDASGALVGAVSQHRLLERVGGAIVDEAWRDRERLERERSALVAKIETRIAEREELLQAAFSQAADGLVLIDLETLAFTEFNDRASGVLGYSRDEFRSLSLLDVQIGLTHPLARASLATLVAAGGGSFEGQHRCKDGSRRDVLVSNRLVRLEGKDYLVAVWHDVTERKRDEIRLLESERKFRLLAENSTEWIYWFDPDGTPVYHSPACALMTGYSPAEFIADPNLVRKIIHQDDRGNFEAHWQAKAGTPAALNFRIVRRDGTERWISHTCQPLADEDGEPLGWRVTNTDITEQQRTAAELAQYRDHLEELVARRTAQLEAASKAKSVFLANMSHEIRTPMNAIIGLTHLAARHCQDEHQQDLLRKVLSSAEHLLAVINDILDIAKIESGRINVEQSDFSPTGLIEKSLALAADTARAKGLVLRTELAPGLPPLLRGDSTHLHQVLATLADNAVKFTDHGSVIVRVRMLHRDAEGLLLRFEIEDTGIGIAPKERSRLFQIFEQADPSATRRHGGTGLGLAIARHLVEMLGGTIGVESEVGSGSLFWFELRFPLGRSPAATLASPAADEAGALEQALATRYRGVRLILAEDNPMNQDVVQELLRDTGLIVDLAANGAEAVRLAKQRRYDLVLMDVQMPVMDGLAATRTLRALPDQADLPIVALTANAFDDDRTKCIQAGMNDFLAKPVQPVALFRALLKWLPEPTSGPADGEPSQAPAGALPATTAAVSDDDLQQRLEQIADLDLAQGMLSVRNRLSTYVRLLGKYMATHAADMANVREQLASGNHDEARRLAHSLKGVSATLGAREVQARALALETAIKDGLDAEQIAACIKEVEAAWSPLVAALVKVLPS